AIGNSNLYQFALSTEDEVRDAAQRANKDGRRNMLVLVPDNEKGILAASIFASQFNSLGGQLVSNTYYDTDKGNLTDSIAQMLQLNQVEIRALQKKLKTLELREAIRGLIRQDADGIFLLASAADAYQIGPSILYFYADNLPLYATSRIYSGRENPVRDEDLNGMMFGDLPWVLAESINKQQMATLSDKTQTRFGRLFAFGIDALNIAPNLYNLATEPETSYTGETGELSISADNYVQKTLQWAQFIDGTPQLLPAQYGLMSN
ncbi:MAG: penicillin-binding protein activator, partial [Pseudomonadales bacterium]|nr:penicillin-binding protein activator [Pseudomonadales bacterium]